MARMMSSGIDVVSFLKEQHEQIKELLNEVRTSSGEQREETFISLRRLLAVHETAEEEIIHPAARSALPDGEAVIEARLAEENELKKMLSRLETMEIGSPEFESEFNLLDESVLLHMEAEETQEFNRLADVLDRDRLERMGKAAEYAEKMAPTRAHPGVESATANLLVGPFAAMVDRVRDAFAGKHPD